MKYQILLSAMMLFCLTAHAEEKLDLASPAGMWQTIPDSCSKEAGYIMVTLDEKQALTAKIAKLASNYKDPRCIKCQGTLQNAPIIGLSIVSALPKTENDTWANEQILDPESGNTYKVRITLVENGTKLKIRGYIGAPAFGRTQYWVRAKNMTK